MFCHMSQVFYAREPWTLILSLDKIFRITDCYEADLWLNRRVEAIVPLCKFFNVALHFVDMVEYAEAVEDQNLRSRALQSCST